MSASGWCALGLETRPDIARYSVGSALTSGVLHTAPMKVGSVEEIVALGLLLRRRLKIPRRRKLLEGRRLLALLLRAEPRALLQVLEEHGEESVSWKLLR